MNFYIDDLTLENLKFIKEKTKDKNSKIIREGILLYSYIIKFLSSDHIDYIIDMIYKNPLSAVAMYEEFEKTDLYKEITFIFSNSSLNVFYLKFINRNKGMRL